MKREWYAVVAQRHCLAETEGAPLRSMTVYASREVANARALVDSDEYPNVGPFVVVQLNLMQDSPA